MDNAVVTVTGQKGSGKSTFARYLLTLTPRAVVFDVLNKDYTHGVIARDFPSALEYFRRRRFDPLRLICRFYRTEEYQLMLRLIWESQRIGYRTLGNDLPPLAVFVEEMDKFASTHSMLPELANLFKYGRHWYISVLGNVRYDASVHPEIRTNSDVIVAFRNIKMSTDFKRYFSDADLIASLETLTPGDTPEPGRHFVTYPPDLDVVALWCEQFKSVDVASSDR